MSFLTRLLFFFCTMIVVANTNAQFVKFHPMDSVTEQVVEQFRGNNFDDVYHAVKTGRRLLNQLLRDNYWLASMEVDSSFLPDTLVISITAGPYFQWKALQLDEQSRFVLEKTKKDPLNESSPMTWVEDVLLYYENYGYPFAALSFDSVNLEGGDMSANVQIDPGPYITIDSITIKGYSSIKRPMLKYQLGVTKGMRYSEKKIRESEKRIDRVEHLTFARPPQVLFSEEKTTLYLYLEEEKNNSFSGIAGLNNLPEGGVTITGEADIRLLNSINQGEDFRLQWRRPGVEMQMLDVNLSVPFPLHLPIGLDAKLNLLRQDSSFFSLEAEIGAQLYINQDWRVRLFYESRSSSVLSQGELPITGVAGFSSRFLQLGVLWDNTNHFMAPTKGIKFSANAGNGLRSSSEESVNQWIAEAINKVYLPIYGQFGFYAQTHFATIYGGELLSNEVYRLGGINTMRGFNEQSLFASTYFVQNLEFRYALDRFSFFQILGDFGFVENTSQHLSGQNLLYAIGAGMSFQTEVGVLNLIYAVGKVDDQPFDFPAAKIHIGYINRF